MRYFGLALAGLLAAAWAPLASAQTHSAHTEQVKPQASAGQETRPAESRDQHPAQQQLSATSKSQQQSGSAQETTSTPEGAKRT